MYKILKPLEKGLFTTLVNKRLTTEVVTQAQLKSVLKYDSNTGTFSWIVARQRVNIESNAGCVSPKGYTLIRIDGRSYFAHRLVWLYHFGGFPKEQVDHIDGNRSNNKLENLRECSNADNAKNQKKMSNNTSGFTGVTFNKVKKKSGKINEYWSANWNTETNKRAVKHFSVCKYGFNRAKELAIDFRAKQINTLISLGIGYTLRHGL